MYIRIWKMGKAFWQMPAHASFVARRALYEREENERRIPLLCIGVEYVREERASNLYRCKKRKIANFAHTIHILLDARDCHCVCIDLNSLAFGSGSANSTHQCKKICFQSRWAARLTICELNLEPRFDCLGRIRRWSFNSTEQRIQNLKLLKK